MSTPRNDCDFLTAGEAARALRYCTTSIRRFVAAGKLPALRIGRQIRIPRRAIEDMVRASEAKVAKA